MLNRTIVSILGVLMMLCSHALASTWYVNGVSGDDGNNCKTAATACATIGHAISLAASGDTLQIFGGNLLTTDQRGKPRAGGGETTGCDMGAYESQTY